MSAKKGAKHHNAKMTAATVRAARETYETGRWILVDGKRQPVNIKNLARKYGVSSQTMHAIIRGKTWTDVR